MHTMHKITLNLSINPKPAVGNANLPNTRSVNVDCCFLEYRQGREGIQTFLTDDSLTVLGYITE